MSWLSKATGIGISKKGIKIDPKRALLTGLAVGTGGFGLLGGGLKLGQFGAGTLLKGSALMAKDKLGTMGVLGAVKGAGKFLHKNKKDIADYGAMAEGVYDRVQENKAAGEYQNRYRSLQPLRDQAMAQLNAPPVDTSSIFADPMAQQPSRFRRIGSQGGY